MIVLTYIRGKARGVVDALNVSYFFTDQTWDDIFFFSNIVSYSLPKKPRIMHCLDHPDGSLPYAHNPTFLACPEETPHRPPAGGVAGPKRAEHEHRRKEGLHKTI